MTFCVYAHIITQGEMAATGQGTHKRDETHGDSETCSDDKTQLKTVQSAIPLTASFVTITDVTA